MRRANDHLVPKNVIQVREYIDRHYARPLTVGMLFVDNQDEARDFYINKLGFEVRTDHTMEGGFHWLTVGPKTQPDLEIVLMEKAGPMFDEESAQAIRLLLKKGVLGSGVFQVDDCHKTYEDLKMKGVQFAARRKIASTASKQS